MKITKKSIKTEEQKIIREINKALDLYGLPKTKYLRSRIAEHMLKAYSNGHRNVKPEDFVLAVQNELLEKFETINKRPRKKKNLFRTR